MLRGWRYALEHPDEISDLILQRYSTRHSKASGVRGDGIEAPDAAGDDRVGAAVGSTWCRRPDHAGSGMLPAAFSIDGLICESGEIPPAWVWSVWRRLVMLMMAIMAAYFARLNRRLESEVERRHRTEGALRDSEGALSPPAEQSQDVIWTLDLQTRRFTYVSPAIRRARASRWRGDGSTIRGRHLRRLLPRHVAAMLESHLARTL